MASLAQTYTMFAMDEEIEKLKHAGQVALGELQAYYSDRLERMIEFRLDDRVRGRVDPTDVMQEAYLEMARRLDDFLQNPSVSFFVWARQITYQVMIGIQRRHFGQKRDPRQEIRGFGQGDGSTASEFILSAIRSQLTTPSQNLMRHEEMEQLKSLLDSMDEIDREVLALRHFEQMSNNQIAESLGISVRAASNRYVRAMSRLSDVAAKLFSSE